MAESPARGEGAGPYDDLPLSASADAFSAHECAAGGVAATAVRPAGKQDDCGHRCDWVDFRYHQHILDSAACAARWDLVALAEVDHRHGCASTGAPGPNGLASAQQ